MALCCVTIRSLGEEEEGEASGAAGDQSTAPFPSLSRRRLHRAV